MSKIHIDVPKELVVEKINKNQDKIKLENITGKEYAFEAAKLGMVSLSCILNALSLTDYDILVWISTIIATLAGTMSLISLKVMIDSILKKAKLESINEKLQDRLDSEEAKSKGVR